MDNAKQFAYYPVAVLQGVDNFTQRHDQREVQDRSPATPIAAPAFSSTSSRTATGWRVRYNDTENNVALWEFHNGIRRPLIRFSDRRRTTFMLDRAAWHELKLTVDGADLEDLARRRARARVHARQRAADPGATTRRRIRI